MTEQEHRLYFRDAHIAHKNTKYIEADFYDETVQDYVVQLNRVCWLYILASFEKPIPAGQWTMKMVVKVDKNRGNFCHSMSPLIKILATPTAQPKKSQEEKILELSLSGQNILDIDSGNAYKVIGNQKSGIKVSKLCGGSSNHWYVLELMPFQLAADSLLTLEWNDTKNRNWKSGLWWYTADLIRYKPCHKSELLPPAQQEQSQDPMLQAAYWLKTGCEDLERYMDGVAEGCSLQDLVESGRAMETKFKRANEHLVQEGENYHCKHRRATVDLQAREKSIEVCNQKIARCKQNIKHCEEQVKTEEQRVEASARSVR